MSGTTEEGSVSAGHRWQVSTGRPAGAPPGGLQPAAEAPAPASARVRVLVVDDEPSICKALEIALRRAGCDVVTVQSGDAAVELAHRERFDVLILDLRIPDMRGDVIFWTVTAVQPHLTHQTLFITGDITEKAQRLIAQCNCPLLHKPFDLRDLLDGVNALAPRRKNATA